MFVYILSLIHNFQAHELGMKYPKHLFLTYGTYESQWWIPPDDEDVHHLCTPEDRARVLEYSFAALDFNFLTEDETDPKAVRFNNDYTARLQTPPFYYNYSSYASYCFDAAWTLAVALNKTIEGQQCEQFRSVRTTLIRIRINMFVMSLCNLPYGRKIW